MANSLNGMIGVGTAPLMAAAISGNIQPSQTAAGTTQATAFAITANYTSFSTVAASTGAVLPIVSATPGLAAQQGDEYEVYNLGANALLVYPGLGASIQTGTTNAGFSVPAAKAAKFVLLNTLVWGVTLSA
jgi:hypothetical protein